MYHIYMGVRKMTDVRIDSLEGLTKVTTITVQKF